MMNGMWPKSAIRYGSRVETKMLRFGAGVGKILLSNGNSSSHSGTRSHSRSSISASSYSNSSGFALNKNNATVIGIICLVSAVGFQIFSYIFYRENNLLPFSYLLFFSSFSLLFLLWASVSLCEIENTIWFKRLAIATILGGIAIIVLMVLPLFNDEAGTFTYLLFSIQLICVVYGGLFCFEERKEKRKEMKEAGLHDIGANTAPKRGRTSRTKRIEEMESRYVRVKAVLEEIKASEKKLSNLTDDIEALREYYESGKWQKDFEADEQGKLPVSLKRGILSEDGLYDMLDEIETHL